MVIVVDNAKEKSEIIKDLESDFLNEVQRGTYIILECKRIRRMALVYFKNIFKEEQR
jgi:hypothetical protein